ncbi:MAG: hypothetical protein RL499_1055, partial [Actinomycetota bacterium]
MPDSLAPGVALRAVTELVADHDDLLAFADAQHPLTALRRGDGIVGIGETLRLSFTGPDRLTDAAAAWRRIAAAAEVVDPVRRPGTGLVAMGTFAFADASSAESVLIVPEAIVERHDG